MFPVLLLLLMVKATFSLPANAYVGKDGSVGASWGGYSASAGLGGIVGGGGAKGGLHAEAGTPGGHFAGAGLSGSTSGGQLIPAEPLSQSAASSSSVSSAQEMNGVVLVPQVPQKGFFDDIFNIPISTLGAVNRYLNNNRKVVAVQSVESSDSAAPISSPSSGNEVAANVKTRYYIKTRPNYDDVFNIPISVLGSVNRFLNGK